MSESYILKTILNNFLHETVENWKIFKAESLHIWEAEIPQMIDDQNDHHGQFYLNGLDKSALD